MSGRTDHLLNNRVPMRVTDPPRSFGHSRRLSEEDTVEVLDANLLESESSGPLAAPEVKVIRFIFGAAFGQSMVVIGLGFLIFQLSAKLPIQDKRAATIITWILTFLTLLLLTWLRKTKKALVFLVLITIELSLLTGFTAILLGDIAPIQFMAILFAQATVLFGYTFVTPRYINLRKIIALLCVVTILTWCLGIFAFYNDRDWITAVFILLAGGGVAIYYIMQVKYASRYHLDEKLQAFSGLFVDPILVTWGLLRKCCQCSCCRTPVEPSPFEEDAVVV
jgi:hypothetical protein